MSRIRIVNFTALVMVGLCLPGIAFAQSYGAIDLGTLGGATTTVSGINDLGEVVGSSVTASGATHAFVTGPNGIGMTDLGTFGGTNSYGNGINNSGQVVGSAQLTGSTSSHAFLSNAPGQMTDLGTLQNSNATASSGATAINSSGQVVGLSNYGTGTQSYAFVTGAQGVGMTDMGTFPPYGGGGAPLTPPYSVANGINDAGVVVGYSIEGCGCEGNGFIGSPTAGGDLANRGALYSYASAINSAGQVTGWFQAYGSNATHAFITTVNGTTLTDLGGLGGSTGSYGYAINAAGVIVGSSFVGNSVTLSHAFITAAGGGAMMDLNTLVALKSGVYLTSAVGINSFGEIVAEGSDGHGYLIMAVPEPSAALLMAICAPPLVAVAVRRRKFRAVA